MEIQCTCTCPNYKCSSAMQENQENTITIQPQRNKDKLPAVELEKSINIPCHLDGIQHLKSIDSIFIERNELKTIWDFPTYHVVNPLGEKVFLAVEESNLCCRCLCASERNFEMHLLDNLNNEVIRMYRPITDEKIAVFCPADVQVGYVQNNMNCFNRNLEVYTSDNRKVLRIKRPNFSSTCCSDTHYYQIKRLTGEVIGRITKLYTRTSSDPLQLEFPLRIDVNLKMVLIGAAFLINHMIYG